MRMMMMQDRRRHKLLMEKLKESLLLRLSALNPSPSSLSIINSPHTSSFIHHRLQQLFNSFHTPTHPPYPSMIKRAIKELNEESGSTEEAISDFIKKEYEDLPWSHVSILDLHLRKLCLDRNLLCTQNGRFVLLVDCDNEVSLRKLESNEDDVMMQLNERVDEEEKEEEEQGKSEKLLLGEFELDQQQQIWSDCEGSAVSTEDHNDAYKFNWKMVKAQIEADESQIQGITYYTAADANAIAFRPPPIREIKQGPHHALALVDLVPFPPPRGAIASTHMSFMDFIPTPRLSSQRPNQL